MTMKLIVWCLFVRFVVDGQVRPAADLQDALQILGLSKFLKNLKEAGLSHILYNRDKYTLFAPTNEAFEKLEVRAVHSPTGSMDKEFLKKILLYHTAYSDWRADDWVNDELIPTALAGMNIRVNIYEQPHGRKGAEKVVTLSGVQVISTNNRAGNGIVHVLNDVIYPMPVASIYDTIASRSELSKFKSYLDQFDMMKMLKYQEPLTIFAPVNEAFEKLPLQFLDTMTSQLPAMAAVLNYHIVNGTYYSAGLFRNTRMHTMESSEIVVAEEARDSFHAIKLNGDAKVQHESYPASNGVVHLVDTVLLPPAHPKQMFYAAKENWHDSQREMKRK